MTDFSLAVSVTERRSVEFGRGSIALAAALGRRHLRSSGEEEPYRRRRPFRHYDEIDASSTVDPYRTGGSNSPSVHCGGANPVPYALRRLALMKRRISAGSRYRGPIDASSNWRRRLRS